MAGWTADRSMEGLRKIEQTTAVIKTYYKEEVYYAGSARGPRHLYL